MADATPDLTETVELAVGGKLYAGWTGVRVTRAIDAITGDFSLSLAWKDDAAAPEFPVAPDDKCQLRLGGETVIDGAIDAVSITISENEHSLQVEGRDRTADLADCSAVNKPGSWTNVRLEAIAADLAKPFGVKVTAKASTGAPIAKFAIQPGETVQAAIERLLRFRGLLAVPTATGDLEIITPAEGAPAFALVLGVNIKSATGRRDHRERFSDYIVKGQASGNDQRHGKAASQIKGSARDSEVRRYRPLLIVAEDQADGASAATRAKFEAGVRKGRSIGAEIVTLGWRASPGGPLFAPAMAGRVQCAPLTIDSVLLCASVTLTKDEGGTTATLSMAPAGAFAPLAEEPKAKAKGKGK